ncbi:MAG: hypothetical protein OXG08_03365 [Gammaproteobacteria bacterium]|nr:hypothetical protein [Gammaproteobacteria bacterium]
MDRHLVAGNIVFPSCVKPVARILEFAFGYISARFHYSEQSSHQQYSGFFGVEKFQSDPAFLARVVQIPENHHNVSRQEADD